MTRQKQIIGTFGIMVSLALGIESVSAQCPSPPTDHDCECNGDDTKWVCATWDQVGAPELVQDFTVDYDCTGCSDAPKVVIIEGGSSTPVAWEVYSEVISTGVEADLGDVLLADDVSPNNGNFAVTIF